MPKKPKYQSLTDCDSREIAVATISNIGLDSVFESHNKETSRPYEMLHHAWELLADGLGETAGYNYLLEELNHIAEFS
jgi:hypothetical protein